MLSESDTFLSFSALFSQGRPLYMMLYASGIIFFSFFYTSIVFNPKDTLSYLYLAKIYNEQNNEKEEIKNLKTTLLLEPQNEEALFMLIDIELKKSNFSEVKILKKKFLRVCKNLCNKSKNINERLKNIEAKNES